jgi:hypothetical protein
MKYIIRIIFLAAGAIYFSGCSNGDLEKRVTDLERRVASLEGGNRPVSNLQKQPVNMDEPTAQVTAPQEKPEGPLPTMVFEEKVHDFGNIKEGAVVTKIFKFKNTGEAPLIISNATSSCGCTVPSYTKEPVAPGESGEMEVKYNSTGKKNQDNKVVRITANTWPTTNNITIKAFVEAKEQTNTAGPLNQ